MTGVVRLERQGAVATIYLNRPDKLNALDSELREELIDHLSSLASEDEVRAIVITGSGRGFCVGQDLSREEELENTYSTIASSYNELARVIRRTGKPVIAAINGPAVGAGMSLALLCDMAVMSRDAILSCAFGRVGLVPDTGITWILARAVGHARAFEIALMGRALSAHEAFGLGLVQRVVDGDGLLPMAHEVATTLSRVPPLTMELTKKQLLDAANQGIHETLDVEALHQQLASHSADHLALRNDFLRR